jgi:hypothetical protein
LLALKHVHLSGFDCIAREDLGFCPVFFRTNERLKVTDTMPSMHYVSVESGILLPRCTFCAKNIKSVERGFDQ